MRLYPDVFQAGHAFGAGASAPRIYRRSPVHPAASGSPAFGFAERAAVQALLPDRIGEHVVQDTSAVGVLRRRAGVAEIGGDGAEDVADHRLVIEGVDWP